MQCRQAMLKAVGLPVFSSITVLHEDAEKPFIPLSMGFCEFKEPAEAIFIAKPEVSDKTWGEARGGGVLYRSPPLL